MTINYQCSICGASTRKPYFKQGIAGVLCKPCETSRAERALKVVSLGMILGAIVVGALRFWGII